MLKVALYAVFVALPGLAVAEPNLMGPACTVPTETVAADLSSFRAKLTPAVEMPKGQEIDATLSARQINAIRLDAGG